MYVCMYGMHVHVYLYVCVGMCVCFNRNDMAYLQN